jgi:soluble P-type ATPase
MITLFCHIDKPAFCHDRFDGTISTPIFPFAYLYYNNHMIELNIPGRGLLQLSHLVCDVNGTLAEDGILITGLHRSLLRLRDRLEIHLITADTHGKQEAIDRTLGLQAVRLSTGADTPDGSTQKADYVRQLGAENVIAIGQGANDAAMLKEAALGICVFSQEGAAVSALAAADIVVPDIHAALELIEKPLRIVATLRT